MINVLFVDDEPKVLRGLQRQIDMVVDDWHIMLASGGTEALSVLRQQPVDVIIADMRMPGLDGISLLAKVAAQYPHIVRLILTGYANATDALRAANFAHQFLAKPIDVEVLVNVVRNTIKLRDMLKSHELRQVVGEIGTLPSVPSLYTRLMRALQSPTVKIDDISRIVSQDMAMTGKMLQLVNSAYFGLPRQISSPKQAVIMLGLNTIRTLALTVHIFAEYNDIRMDGFSLVGLQQHGLLVSSLAKEVAHGLMMSDYEVDSAVTAGMLHVLGRLILASSMPRRYRNVLAKAKTMNIMLDDVEANLLGVSHGMVGAYLLALWGLPLSVIEAVFFHHSPEQSPCDTNKASPLMAVHIADVLAYQVSPVGSVGKQPELSPVYRQNPVIQTRLPYWQEVARQLVAQEGNHGK